MFLWKEFKTWALPSESKGYRSCSSGTLDIGRKEAYNDLKNNTWNEKINLCISQDRFSSGKIIEDKKTKGIFNTIFNGSITENTGLKAYNFL